MERKLCENEKAETIELILKKETDQRVTLVIEWQPSVTGNITCIYVEIHDMSPGAEGAFHAFLYNHCKKTFDLLKHLDHDNYQFYVYGLQRAKNKKYYILRASGRYHLQSFVRSDESKMVGKISLVKDCSYYHISKMTRNSSRLRIRHVMESQYEVSGLSKSQRLKTTIIIVQQTSPTTTYILHRQSSENSFQLPFSLTPAKEHSFFAHHCTSIGEFEQKLFSSSDFAKIENFMTYMTTTELQQLFGKAVYYIGNSGSAQLYYFYRNKPPTYFQEIYQKHGGIMFPYLKDNNGDRASIINGNIKGLFFSATVDKNSIPLPASYFGKRRLFVTSDIIFHKNTNLYFADFYCHYESKHYVTLVATEKGSASDIFCRCNLLPLDIYNNPFINLVPFMRQTSVYVTIGIRVEVLYTEAINLNFIEAIQGGVIFQDVPVLGRGSSRPSGIPKNPNCQICNLNKLV